MTPSEIIKAAEDLANWHALHGKWEDAALIRSLIALVPKEGMVVVPEEPTEKMSDRGEYVNSEWLNDNAPLGQRRYRKPAIAVYKAMLAAAKEKP